MINLAKLIKTGSALRRNRRGVVLPETALIMPMLLVMLLAGYEVARFALLQQKLSRTTISTADLITQGETVSSSALDTILSATGVMMRPFGTGSHQRVIISSVSAVGAAAPKVDWQYAGGGSLTGVTSKIGAKNANATLPTGFLVRNGENVIIAEIFYQFSPTFAEDLVPPRTLYHRAMFRPRVTTLKICTGCP